MVHGNWDGKGATLAILAEGRDPFPCAPCAQAVELRATCRRLNSPLPFVHATCAFQENQRPEHRHVSNSKSKCVLTLYNLFSASFSSTRSCDRFLQLRNGWIDTPAKDAAKKCFGVGKHPSRANRSRFSRCCFQVKFDAYLDDLEVSNYIADLVTFSRLICRTLRI